MVTTEVTRKTKDRCKKINQVTKAIISWRTEHRQF